MSHALEVVENKAAFAFREKGGMPWHGLGQTLTDDATTEQVLDLSKTGGWNTRLRQIDTGARVITESYEVVRDNPFDGGEDRLAVVGERYHVVPNEEIAEFAATIVDGGGADGSAKWETGGSIRDGRVVFYALELGEGITLDPNGQADKIGQYITVASSHDGSSAVTAFMGNVRVVCQNTLTAALSAKQSVYRIKHTQSAKGRIEEARKALSIAFAQSKTFEQEMNTLIAEEMNRTEFWELVSGIYKRPEKDSKGSVKKWETKTDTIMDIWDGSAEGGNTVDGLENTAYKAYNVLNENLMWYGRTRKGESENVLVKASGLDDLTNKTNLDLYRRVLATV